MTLRKFMNLFEDSLPATIPAETPPALSAEVPHTITDLPSVVGDALSANGAMAHIRWTQVKNLPGQQIKMIKRIGEHVFAPFTATPTDDIQCISSFKNSETEMRTVAHFLVSHGERTDTAELHYDDVFPGYHPSIAIYKALGYEFMIVRDKFGEYIYAFMPLHMEHVPVETPALTHPSEI